MHASARDSSSTVGGPFVSLPKTLTVRDKKEECIRHIALTYVRHDVVGAFIVVRSKWPEFATTSLVCSSCSFKMTLNDNTKIQNDDVEVLVIVRLRWPITIVNADESRVLGCTSKTDIIYRERMFSLPSYFCHPMDLQQAYTMLKLWRLYSDSSSWNPHYLLHM